MMKTGVGARERALLGPCSVHRPLFPRRAAYGLIMRPNDFASYLLAIGICNLLLYFAFYIIMKVRGGAEPLRSAALPGGVAGTWSAGSHETG